MIGADRDPTKTLIMRYYGASATISIAQHCSTNTTLTAAVV